MTFYKNKNGIALVMALVFSTIALMIVAALIYMVTQSALLSGGIKFYKTAEEAAFGAIDLATKDYIDSRGTLNVLGAGFANGCNCGNPLDPNDNLDLTLGPPAASCRCNKLCNSFQDWDAGGVVCDENAGAANIQIALNPTQQPDFNFDLGINPNIYRVFTKIVDTARGNSATGGVGVTQNLGGGGVVSANAGVVTPPHVPYLYRIEVQAQAIANPREISRMSVLYAY
ncbi:MAG: pilus assembly PilX N-terminal domain-containing protein [Porphyromonadaceae bacterium]|nr:pilus assembly PilX N-terminal domain-containing protein [Porphyromonadaceae bacterium]